MYLTNDNRGFAQQPCSMAGTIDSFSYGKKMFFLMQNIFIVPSMQHGCRAKPLLSHHGKYIDT